MLKILQYGSPVLEQKAKEIEDPSDPKILNLIDEMLKVLEKESHHSAGLSAPQVGEGLRLAICRRVDLEDEEREQKMKEFEGSQEGNSIEIEPIWEVMINPKIIKRSETQSTFWEGCLSINEGDLFGQVTRPSEVDVEFTNIEGQQQKIKAKGFFAHVVQHEMDHLDGILFLRYVKDPSELYTGEELEDLDS